MRQQYNVFTCDYCLKRVTVDVDCLPKNWAYFGKYTYCSDWCKECHFDALIGELHSDLQRRMKSHERRTKWMKLCSTISSMFAGILKKH